MTLDLTPEERTLRARQAAYASWANTSDRTARTSAGNQKFFERFVDQVDPERKLPEKERLQRADAAFKSYMAGLALKSAKARRKRKEAGAAGNVV